MDWLNSWNDVIKYIEDNIDDDIDVNHIAKLVCCSNFHFQRMFSYITDISLYEYIRRRRMTRAAEELQSTDTKVIDIAIKYGYDSPTAFNRAFQKIHGIAPSKAREKGVKLKAYPPINFRISIKGEEEMNYRIEEKGEFKIVGVKKHYNGLEESFANVPSFWDGVKKDNLIPELCKVMDSKVKGILGVCSSACSEEFDYYIAVATKQETPKHLEEFIIPKATWAIFECKGAMPQAIQKMQKAIMSDWLPNSGYKYANLPDIEVYFDGDQSSDDYKSEVWIPIIKK